MKNFISFFSSMLSTLTIYFFGGLDIAFQTLLVFIVIDYLTGVLRSYIYKKIK